MLKITMGKTAKGEIRCKDRVEASNLCWIASRLKSDSSGGKRRLHHPMKQKKKEKRPKIEKEKEKKGHFFGLKSD